MPDSRTISFNLPEETIEQLDQVAARSRLSPSLIIQQALARHFQESASEDHKAGQTAGYADLLRMEGAGIGPGGPRSKSEIDAHIRWLRDDD